MDIEKVCLIMSDVLLSVFHSTTDEQGLKGCLSLYYANSIPTLSFAAYDGNSSLTVLSFKVIRCVRASGDKISLYISGQPSPSVFQLSSEMQVWSFIQIIVANGIVKKDTQEKNAWIQSPNLKISNPMEWIFQSSAMDKPISLLYERSSESCLQNLKGVSFTGHMHQNKIKSLTDKGKSTTIFKQISMPVTASELLGQYDDLARTNEYTVIKRQWQNRISHQNGVKSKHNLSVDNLNKDLVRMIDNEGTSKLIYNVIRTMITFAPDIGFVQGMVDVALMAAEIVLDGHIESCDEKSEARVFWAMNNVMFRYGQYQWYKDTYKANTDFVSDLSSIIPSVYPALGSFVSYKDYKMLKHLVASSVTLFTRMFADKEITKKIWKIMVSTESCSITHESVMVAVFCLEFPKLVKTRVPDIAQITKMIESGYHVEDEEEFLAVIAAVIDSVPPKDELSEAMNLSLTLFKPMAF